MFIRFTGQLVNDLPEPADGFRCEIPDLITSVQTASDLASAYLIKYLQDIPFCIQRIRQLNTCRLPFRGFIVSAATVLSLLTNKSKEIIKEIFRIGRTAGGFGVELYGADLAAFMPDALVGPIIQLMKYVSHSSPSVELSIAKPWFWEVMKALLVPTCSTGWLWLRCPYFSL
jgi:hypothetical protein